MIIIILVSIIANIYMISNKPEENNFNIEGIDTVKNEEILKDTTIEGLKITNISLLTRNGISTYKANVTNTTTEEININKLYVIFHENTKESKILALMNINLKPNASTSMTITSELELSNTTKIEYVIENNEQ